MGGPAMTYDELAHTPASELMARQAVRKAGILEQCEDLTKLDAETLFHLWAQATLHLLERGFPAPALVAQLRLIAQIVGSGEKP